MRPTPKVGQILYSLNVGNASHRKEQKLTPVVVTKVGRKYFTCERVEGVWKDTTEYYLDDWAHRSNYTASSYLYVSEQEWFDEKEAYELRNELLSKMHDKKLNLEQLRAVKNILENYK